MADDAYDHDRRAFNNAHLHRLPGARADQIEGETLSPVARKIADGDQLRGEKTLDHQILKCLQRRLERRRQSEPRIAATAVHGIAEVCNRCALSSFGEMPRKTR